ncbi:glycosyltransferase [Microbacterium sp. NPDC019599]|uniref:glycosyltransferase n=1 Tax=Microbacterium sp. NPDC019599 TaxID=3154690 RepID=UPI0033FC32DB
MSNPIVSVVIPAYNVAEFLGSAVDQLVAQTLDDIEIIIVDDGSTDGSAELALELAAAEPRVRVVIQPENAGVARARRRATQEARGEYLWFVDADDAWPETALEQLVARARQGDLDVTVAGATFVYGGGASTRPLRAPASPDVDGRDAFQMLLTGGITGHLWNKLFRRELMARCTFAPARVQSDLIMVADALSRAGRVGFLDRSVYDYRLRSGSIITSNSRRAESLAIIDAAVAENVERLGLADSPDYRYFRARYVHLSGIKDALVASYDRQERAELLKSCREALSLSDVWRFARDRDFKRFTLAATAKTSVRAHHAILRAADR